MRMPITQQIDWARSPEAQRWCENHGLRYEDVLVISFGVVPPRDVKLESLADFARVYIYERDESGRRVMVGSRGDVRPKHATPRFVEIHWWPTATRSYLG